MSSVSRRNLVPGAAAAFTLVPRHVLGGTGYRAPSDKLNIAGVGVGAMGGHTLHVIFRALELAHPIKVHATSARLMRLEAGPATTRPTKRPLVQATPETLPAASVITRDFAARGHLPPVRVTWYDGGLQPPRPPEVEPGKSLGGDGVLFFIGDGGVILSVFTGRPKLVPDSKHAGFTPPPRTMPPLAGHCLNPPYRSGWSL